MMGMPNDTSYYDTPVRLTNQNGHYAIQHGPIATPITTADMERLIDDLIQALATWETE